MRRRPPILRPSEAVNLAGVDTGRDTISATKVSRFLGCHRKYQLHHLKRLELIARPRSFTLGTAYQKAIEHQDPEVGVRFLNGFVRCENCDGSGWIREAPRAGDDNLAPELSYDPCNDCQGTGWRGEQVHFYTDEAEADHHVNEAIVRAASKLYLKTFPAPAGEVREFEFRVPLRSPYTGAYSLTYDLLGYADGLIDLMPHALTYEQLSYANVLPPITEPFELTENKLVDRLMPVSVRRLPLDRQLALLRYGVWRATGRHVGKINYRFMLKPSIKQRGGRKKDKSDAETLEQFCERIEADYEERPEFYCRPVDPLIPDSDGDLLRIEADLWEWARQLREEHRSGHFDRNTSHCTDFGGCPYLPICTGDPDAATLYRERPRFHEDIKTTISQEA